MPKPLLWLLLLAASLNAIQAEEFVDVDRKSRSDPDFSHIIDEPNHVGEIGDKVNVSVAARHFSLIRKKYWRINRSMVQIDDWLMYAYIYKLSLMTSNERPYVLE